MSIIIAGDIVPTHSNEKLFDKGNVDSLIGKELKTLLKEVDFRVFNLETPLVEKETPIRKCGPCLSAPISTVTGIKEMGWDLASIANNHIMDQGANGLESTLNLLRQNHISTVGAGDSIFSASTPYIINSGGKTVGFYSCVEHEFSCASESIEGANPFDFIESYNHIYELKKTCDHIVVLFHGGKEHYRYPSPLLQKVCRNFIDKGADLVICQHSHCIGCFEKYHLGTIIYGQGNFIFDHLKNECWDTGLLIRISDSFEIDYIPVVRSMNGVRLAGDHKKNEILSEFKNRSEEIKDKKIIVQKYEELSYSYIDGYLYDLSGKDNILYKSINKILNNGLRKLRFRHRYNDEALLRILNHIECESHNELFVEGIKNYIKKRGTNFRT